MTFKTWLARYQNLDAPRGDFARDVLHDKTFPAENNYFVILDYLKSRGACKEAIRAFQMAWKSYERESRRMEMSEVSERDIEAYLRNRVKALGGRAYKFVSPGNAGVPDRLVLLPGGRAVFVELKAPGRHPTPLQVAQQQRIAALGFDVRVIDSFEGVDELIRQYER